MNARNMSRWGQAKPLGPAWTERSPNVVTFLESTELPCPEVLTANLGVEYLTPFFDVSGFRWQLSAGVGGANRIWLIDALPMQQVSLPAHSLTASVIAEPYFIGDVFVDPQVRLRASAFIARGNTSTSQAQYSQGIRLDALGGANAARLLPFPAGAVGFRLLSTVPALSAATLFHVDVTVSYVAGGFAGTATARYQGTDFEAISKTDGYVPLPGGVDSLIIANVTLGQPRAGSIIWELDL